MVKNEAEKTNGPYSVLLSAYATICGFDILIYKPSEYSRFDYIRYAKPLTTLRQHARMVKFTPAAPVHLVKRLKEICVLESLVPDTRALSTLVAIAKGDMRGCLNTLQVRASNH